MKSLNMTLDEHERRLDQIWKWTWIYLSSFLPFLLCYAIFVGGIVGTWSVPGAAFWHVVITAVTMLVMTLADGSFLRLVGRWSGVCAVINTLEDYWTFAAVMAWFLTLEIVFMLVSYCIVQVLLIIYLCFRALILTIGVALRTASRPTLSR